MSTSIVPWFGKSIFHIYKKNVFKNPSYKQTFLSFLILLKIYKQTILSIFDFGCSVWMECSNSMIDSLERLQNQVVHTILKANRTSCNQSMRSNLGLLTLKKSKTFSGISVGL